MCEEVDKNCVRLENENSFFIILFILFWLSIKYGICPFRLSQVHYRLLVGFAMESRYFDSFVPFLASTREN